MSPAVARRPEVGDSAIVLGVTVSNRTRMVSGTISFWDTEVNIFTVIDPQSLESVQYDIRDFTFYYNEKGETWFIDYIKEGARLLKVQSRG